jgi:hypothetical protein
MMQRSRYLRSQCCVYGPRFSVLSPRLICTKFGLYFMPFEAQLLISELKGMDQVVTRKREGHYCRLMWDTSTRTAAMHLREIWNVTSISLFFQNVHQTGIWWWTFEVVSDKLNLVRICTCIRNSLDRNNGNMYMCSAFKVAVPAGLHRTAVRSKTLHVSPWAKLYFVLWLQSYLTRTLSAEE